MRHKIKWTKMPFDVERYECKMPNGLLIAVECDEDKEFWITLMSRNSVIDIQVHSIAAGKAIAQAIADSTTE